MEKNFIEDGAVYQAKVIDQIVTRNKNEELQVVFTAKISGKLSDDRDPHGSVEPVAPIERDIFVTFAGDPKKLAIALDHLKQLGFEDADVVKLHPDHPKFFSIIGKDVHLRCKTKGESIFWNFAWFRARPKAVKLEEAQSAAELVKLRIERMRGDLSNQDNSGDQTTDSLPRRV